VTYEPESFIHGKEKIFNDIGERFEKTVKEVMVVKEEQAEELRC
jgi:hypothetical protein